MTLAHLWERVSRTFGQMCLLLAVSMFGSLSMNVALVQAQAGSGTCDYVCNTGGAVVSTPNTSDCAGSCPSTASSACGSHGGLFGWRCTNIVSAGSGTPTTNNDSNWTEPGSSCVRTALQPPASRSERSTQVQSVISRDNILGGQFSCVNGADAAFTAAHCVVGGCGSGSDRCCSTTPPAPAASAGCAQTALNAITDTTQRATAQTRLTGINSDLSTFTCQRVCSNVTATRDSRCITGGCPGQDAAVLCCAAGTGAAPANSCPAAGGTTSGGGGSSFALQLPSCISDGNCQLSDVLQTGVNFANFLFGLAGGLFLAIFVWAGFQYVFFSYDSGAVKKAKDMMTNAMIGLLLMMAGGLFIRFVSSAVGGTSGVSQASCEVSHPGFSCANIGAGTAAARTAAQGRGCVANACPGTAQNIMCCPAGAATPPAT